MKKFFPFLLVAVLAASCHNVFGDKIKGNGNIKTESRTAGIFSSVDVSGSLDVYVTQDSACSVKVEADENLMEYIIIRTEGDVLVVEPRDGYNLSGRIKIYVSSPVFKRFEVSGASLIASNNILTSSEVIAIQLSGASDAKLEVKAPSVSIDVSGASTALVKGQTKDLFIEGSGASNAKCFELLSENAEVDISGASNADVFASVKLNAEASGASDVRYKGNAAVTSNTSGAGNVKKVE
jgi:Putative auto-transporter adhesin, head GIN domain